MLLRWYCSFSKLILKNYFLLVFLFQCITEKQLREAAALEVANSTGCNDDCSKLMNRSRKGYDDTEKAQDRYDMKNFIIETIFFIYVSPCQF